MHGRYVTDILKMCMKQFNAEKIFLTNLQGFDLHLAGGYTVSLACSQFLVLSLCGAVAQTLICLLTFKVIITLSVAVLFSSIFDND